MRIVLVDHLDSFTWNLAHALGEITGELPDVVEGRALEPGSDRVRDADLVVLGPGPGHPAVAEDAGGSLALIGAIGGRVPLFGVCFGLELLVHHCGGRVTAVPPMHGRSSRVEHDGTGAFRGLPSPIEMMRYHSLAAERASLPPSLEVVAQAEDRAVMAVRHREWPAHAVQFHPESVGSPLGARLLRNVVEMAREWNAAHADR